MNVVHRDEVIVFATDVEDIRTGREACCLSFGQGGPLSVGMAVSRSRNTSQAHLELD